MQTDERIERYAPLLRFSAQDPNYPIDPGRFVVRSRLRRFGWSSHLPDGFWNPAKLGWDGSLDLVPPAHATSPDLSRACALMQLEAPSRAGAGRNRRPNDPHNIWDGRRAGYGLELTQAFARELRGVAGSAPFLLVDRYRVTGDDVACDVITYWSFYALHVSARPHEGDWVPVSVLCPCDGSEPQVRYSGGATWSLSEVERAEATHPVVYVEPGSHDGYRSADELDNGGPNALLLRTWRLTPRPIQEMPWSCYDGAWGRVGATDATTGSLGPLLRRLGAADIAGPAEADRDLAPFAGASGH